MLILTFFYDTLWNFLVIIQSRMLSCALINALIHYIILESYLKQAHCGYCTSICYKLYYDYGIKFLVWYFLWLVTVKYSIFLLLLYHPASSTLLLLRKHIIFLYPAHRVSMGAIKLLIIISNSAKMI